MMSIKLLSINSDAKTIKGIKKGFLTGICYLSAGAPDICTQATKGCLGCCLQTAGRGVFKSVQEARQKRTELFRSDPEEFYKILAEELNKLSKKALRKNLTPAARLNGTSDCILIDPSDHPEILFYEYTKSLKQLTEYLDRGYASVTFSRSENNWHECQEVLEKGLANVAVVFKGDLPMVYKGYKVIDGDLHDARFLDPKGVIVGLKAKGRALKDLSGFVVDNTLPILRAIEERNERDVG